MAREEMLDDVDLDNIGGFDRVEPGSYHMLIIGVNEDGGRKGEMIVDFEVLRGTTPGQEGKVYRESFSWSIERAKNGGPGMPTRKRLALALATGLITKDGGNSCKAAGKPATIDYTAAMQRQVVINIEAGEYNGKPTARLAFDEIYAPGDKRCRHVPLVKAMLDAAGIVLPEGRDPNGIARPAPAQSSVAKAASDHAARQQANVTATATAKPANDINDLF